MIQLMAPRSRVRGQHTLNSKVCFLLPFFLFGCLFLKNALRPVGRYWYLEISRSEYDKKVLHENLKQLIRYYTKMCSFSYNVLPSLFRNEQKASQGIIIPIAC